MDKETLAFEHGMEMKERHPDDVDFYLEIDQYEDLSLYDPDLDRVQLHPDDVDFYLEEEAEARESASISSP